MGAAGVCSSPAGHNGSGWLPKTVGLEKHPNRKEGETKCSGRGGGREEEKRFARPPFGTYEAPIFTVHFGRLN